jgi:glycerate kinase
MRVLVAFDKFKEALSAPAACGAAAGALRAKHPDWTLDLCPLTDGGDGFCETLTHAAGGRLERVLLTGPTGYPVNATVGFVAWDGIPSPARARLSAGGRAEEDASTVAIVDLASASGLNLIPPAERKPWRATSRGTGELLAAALRGKPSTVLIGVGGSATNDLGCGALAALGLRFLDAFGTALQPPTPDRWEEVSRLDGRIVLPPLFIACDVTNPLLGLRGATFTFGPQKGLLAGDVRKLDALAARMASMLCDHCGKPRSLVDLPGAGAAGGLAFGLMVAGGGSLVPGFELVADWLDLPARIAAADLVITGEGRFDATSLAGKAPGTLAAHARWLGKPAHVFAGSLGVPGDRVHHAITPEGMPLAEALPRTAELLAAAIGRVFSGGIADPATPAAS